MTHSRSTSTRDSSLPSRKKPPARAGPTSDALAAALRDLQAHQAELESQNEELRRAQCELVAARDRYAELYDSAPVGYLTLDRRGVILQANLRLAEMLSVPRRELLQRPLTELIHSADQDVIHLHLRRLSRATGHQRCELRLGTQDHGTQGHAPFWASLRSVPGCREEGREDVIRIAVNDIGERKRVEQELDGYRAALRRLTQRLQDTVEQERIHLAREVHDDIGQDLVALKLDLSWLATKLRPDQQWLRQRFEATEVTLQGLLQTVRRVATGLRPNVLDDLGLAAALTSHFDHFRARYAIDGTLLIEPADLEVPAATATVLFRVFQEALTNVARHARASAVRVRLQQSAGQLELVVADDGQGMSLDPREGDGLGIVSMREQIEALGGRLEVVGRPGEGTTLSFSLPRA